MTSPGEVFVMQLARASRKANFLVRRLSRPDREDILAEAMAWCWVNRANYSLTTTLETWFVGAVRDAMKTWRRGEIREAAKSLADIPTGDSTLADAEARSSAQALANALPAEYKTVAKMQMEGKTRAEMLQQGVSRDTYDAARERIKQLSKLIPDAHEYRRVLRASAPISDKQPRYSSIDREMAALEFPPPRGNDCPPCWRCKWFEGYLPGAHRPTRMDIVERNVKAAVLRTEKRKVEIAYKVRDGAL
jgi:DNA-directed RNA polymerase specialized sigma24 family protein